MNASPAEANVLTARNSEKTEFVKNTGMRL